MSHCGSANYFVWRLANLVRPDASAGCQFAATLRLFCKTNFAKRGRCIRPQGAKRIIRSCPGNSQHNAVFLRSTPSRHRRNPSTDGPHFCKNAGLSSKLCFVICLADSQGHHNVEHWRSGESCQVVELTLAAERLAVVDAFDHARTVKYTPQELGIPNPENILYMDNRSGLNAMS
ncbi:hypothetical protein FVE85_9824 [Porphyridium purpureum]|uniref:Uncharacterized protein n=1 Tax=Porphyridium purpureum TaxID=35688 RepID=A0A5J4YIR6_PORPP|nr:hypothetical protein FVE85_9824 [Porphyridium purpureum]|eukprot:POR8944..scf289_17